MNLQWTPFILIYLFAACLSWAAIGRVLQRRETTVIRRTGLLLLIAGGVWVSGALLELLYAGMEEKVFWHTIQFTAALCLPTLWLLFALNFANHHKRITLQVKVILGTIPFLVFLLALTNPAHHLVFSHDTIFNNGSFNVLLVSFGPAMWVYSAYAAVLVLSGMSFIGQTFHMDRQLYRWQSIVLLLSSGGILLVNITFDTLGWWNPLELRFTALALGLVLPAVSLGLDQLRRIDLLPVLKDSLLSGLGDAVILLDESDCILEMNVSAQGLLHVSLSSAFGKKLADVWPTWEGIQPECGAGKARREIELEADGVVRCYELRQTKLHDRTKRLVSKVIVLHDISELKLRNAELFTILETARAISSTLDLETVLIQIAQAMQELTDADGCTLSRWDRGQDSVTTWIEYRRAAGENVVSPGSSYPLRNFPATRSVLEQRRTIMVRLSDPYADLAEKASMRKDGIQSLLMAPMSIGDRVIGLVEVFVTRQDREFSENQVRLCGALANQAAVAIENASLHAETQKRLHEQILLRETGEAISSALDFDTLLNRIAEQMGRALDATSAYICSYHSESGVFKILADYVTQTECNQGFLKDSDREYLRHERKFLEFLEFGQFKLSHRNDPQLSPTERSYLNAFEIETILYIPLRVKGRPIGFAELWECRRERHYSDDEISLCLGVAQQAAIALENSRLYQQAQQEIADRVRAEERLLYDALHDSLTGLPNRTLFMDRLGHACQLLKRRSGYQFSVLFLDCDSFKVINDSLGHAAGDDLLVLISRRLQAALRPMDTIARLGGDEFVILLEDIHTIEDVILVVDRIQGVLGDPLSLGGRKIFMSASIGIVSSSVSGTSPQEILRDADIAMYRAKADGKARYVVFQPEMREQAFTRLELETDLRQALEHDELKVFYQPIISLLNGRLIGFEALVRWDHPQRGSISPSELIPIAEDAGLITSLDLWVLREACGQLSQWYQTFPGLPMLTMNVNLSSQHFSHLEMIERITSVLEESKLLPGLLQLEITESAIMGNAEAAIQILSRFQEMGIRVNIDDFGTGYSSLSYLHRFPIDAIKIDRSFISKIGHNGSSSGLVNTIVSLAHELGMEAVAEGIETDEQRELLQMLNCEYGQGFLFSQAVDSYSAEQIIMKRHGLPAKQEINETAR